MRTRLFGTAFVGLFLLTSCGGGGGSGSAPAPTLTYTIGGSITGLIAGNSVTIGNGTNSATISSNGPFVLTESVTQGSSYNVAVVTQPNGQTCTVSAASSVASSNVTNVAVTCTPNSYSIGGSVSGLPTEASVVISNSGTNSTTLSTNGTYTFSSVLNYGSAYSVTVSSSPKNFQCSLENGVGSIKANVTNANVICTLSDVFESTAIQLPDLRAKYDSLCGDDVVTRVALANMSKHTDGKKDFVVVMFCIINPVGTKLASTVPTKNGMVIIRQRVDGTFYDATNEIFGIDMVDVGGALGEEHVATYDMNGDGYDEVVFSPTGEDGRVLLYDDPTTWNNKQAVFLTSLGDGRYKIEKLGTPSYGSRDDLVDNQYGSKDVITTVIGYGGKSEAWRYSKQLGWSLTSDYNTLGNDLAGLYFPRESAAVGTSSHIAAPTVTSLRLYTAVSPGMWVKQSDWSFSGTIQAQLVSWNSQVGPFAVNRINGKDYGFLAFNSPCAFRRSPSQRPIALYEVPASEIVGGYTGQVLHESSSDFQSHTLLLGFSIDGGTLSPVDLGLKNEITDKMPLRFDCPDINNDGYQDAVISTWGSNAKPIVYLNTKINGLASVNLTRFPTGSTSFRGNTTILEDIDGDGIPDLFVYPLNGIQNKPSKVQFEIYKGKRLLDTVDLNN